jgi:flagellar assembly protein FliH
MKPSSSEPAARGGGPTVRSTVRTARFDRPLTSIMPGGGIADAETERRVQQAVEEGRTAGQAQGYAAGWAQGRRAAAEAEATRAQAREQEEVTRRAEQAAQVIQVLASLTRAAQQVDTVMAPAWEELADVIADGVLTLARGVLGRELSSLPAPVVESVRTALRAIGPDGGVTLRLHPTELAVVNRVLGQELPDGVRLVADAGLDPGQVMAAGPATRLRTSLPSAIAAAEEVLRA